MPAMYPNNKQELTVLHIAPTPFFSDRGCHIRIRGIIKGLEHKSVHNILCTYHHGREIEGIETFRITGIPGYTMQEAGPSGYKYIADVLLLLKVCSLIRKERPDVIHGHLHEGVLIGWIAKILFFWRRIVLVFDMQGSLVGELDAHGYFLNKRWLKKLFLRTESGISHLPRYIVCSSPHSVDILLNQFELPEERVFLASDGIDITGNGDHLAHELRKRLSLPDNKPVIIYTGALLKAKGLEALQKMLCEAAKRNLNVHFLLIGYPEQEIQSFIADHHLQSLCTVTGRIPFDRLGNYLSLATAAIEPKAENTGEASGKLLNYIGAGLPVICFDTTNNRKILGETGYFSAPESVNGIVDHIEDIIQHPEEAASRGIAGRERVREDYSWDATANVIYSIYQKELNQPD